MFVKAYVNGKIRKGKWRDRYRRKMLLNRESFRL
jgi:hypothetical protein